MALSKGTHFCQWIFPESPLFPTHPHVCPFPQIPSFCCCPFFCFIAVCLFLFLFLSVCLSVSFSLSLFYLSDKLDEILAAAQQSISTNEAPGTRGQGPKRDRGRSFYGNEVCIVKPAMIYLHVSHQCKDNTRGIFHICVEHDV